MKSKYIIFGSEEDKERCCKIWGAHGWSEKELDDQWESYLRIIKSKIGTPTTILSKKGATKKMSKKVTHKKFKKDQVVKVVYRGDVYVGKYKRWCRDYYGSPQNKHIVKFCNTEAFVPDKAINSIKGL